MDAVARTRVRGESVALTFDDGPSPWTPAVLTELDRAEARATFFVTPGTCPGLVRRIAAEGHEVAYHCRRHVRHTDRRRRDVRREALVDIDWLRNLGLEPTAWRPPWGALADWSADLAAKLSLELWLWSDDTHDWDGRGAGEILAELGRALEGGSVVLMHDGLGPGALRPDTLATVELIGPLVDLCRARGLTPTTLSERMPARA